MDGLDIVVQSLRIQETAARKMYPENGLTIPPLKKSPEESGGMLELNGYYEILLES